MCASVRSSVRTSTIPMHVAHTHHRTMPINVACYTCTSPHARHASASPKACNQLCTVFLQPCYNAVRGRKSKSKSSLCKAINCAAISNNKPCTSHSYRLHTHNETAWRKIPPDRHHRSLALSHTKFAALDGCGGIVALELCQLLRLLQLVRWHQ